MKWPSLQRADWLMLGVLLPVALLAALLGHLASRGDDTLRPPIASSYHTDAAGTRALYMVWDRLGYGVDRLRRTIDRSRIQSARGMVILAPWHPLLLHEQQELLAWVSEGGQLLIAPGPAWADQWLNLKTQPDPRDILFPGRQRDQDDEPAADRARAGRELAQDAPLLAGVRELTTRPRFRLDPDNPLRGELSGSSFHVFWEDDDGAAGIHVEHGRGQLWILGDTHPLSNLGLREADNAIFAANLAYALTGGPPGGTILFDEYHHGFDERDTSGVAIIRLILDEGRAAAAAQALIVAALAVFAAAVRFGRPRQPITLRTRGQGEFIRAAARLLGESRGAPRVGYLLRYHYRRRLCRLLRLDPRTEDTALARAVAERSGIDIRHALNSMSGDRRLNEAQLLRAAQTLHHATETLTHGTR